MSEFDDPQLERMLGRAGGALPDVNSAYAQVQGRVRHIKRRRAMVAGTTACFLLAAGAVFAAGRTDERSNLQPGDRGSLDIDSTDPDDSSVTDDSTSDSSLPGSNGTGNTTANSGSNSGSSSPSTSNGSTPTSGTTPASPVEQQFDSIGGSITVRLANGALTLITSNPAGGFTIESSDTSATRVEVRFTDGNHDSRIRVDLVAGAMQPRIDEN